MGGEREREREREREIITIQQFLRIQVTFVIIYYSLYCRKFIIKGVMCKTTTCMAGKTIIVTGASSGIGKATAAELARRGQCIPVLFEF